MEENIKQYFREMGAKGGNKILQKYGRKHFQELGKKGGSKKNDDNKKDEPSEGSHDIQEQQQ